MRSLLLWKSLSIVRVAGCVAGSSAWLLFSSVVFGESPDLLPNLLPVADGIYSGGEPAGDKAFAKLAQLGIKTVVSVDGVKPDLDAARRHGIQYVHIPIGYDGISAEAGAALTRVARETAMPVFVHCHHGHHRSPAAASVLAIAGGCMNHPQAADFMKRAGTSPDYKGLWRDVAAYEPPAHGARLPDLVESAKLEGLQEIMGRLERHFDRLKKSVTDASEKAGNAQASETAEIAVLVRECLRESQRVGKPDARLLEQMRSAEKTAGDVVRLVTAGDHPAASARVAALRKNCVDCHRQFRD